MLHRRFAAFNFANRFCIFSMEGDFTGTLLEHSFSFILLVGGFKHFLYSTIWDNPSHLLIFTPLRVGWPPTPQILSVRERSGRPKLAPTQLYRRNVSKTFFLTVFSNFASQTDGTWHECLYHAPCKILLCTMFFSFLAVFPLPESYQNDPKFHFKTLLRSDTQKSAKKAENTTIG